MSKTIFTTEQLADRWMDRREVQNLMGKYVYYKLLKDEAKLVDDFWAARDDVSLGINEGYYVGREAIKGYYAAINENTKIRSEHMKNLFPLFFEGKTDAELHGVGSLEVDALTSCVIEQAEDGQTIKAAWYVEGCDTNIHAIGPYSYWGYGAIAADFVLEDGEWKIWHMLDLVDLDGAVGKNWVKPEAAEEVRPEFAALADKLVALPEPTIVKTLHTAYYPGRELEPLVEVPEPYVTFADTFSYGV